MSVPPPASSHQSISQLVARRDMLRDALGIDERDLKRAKQLHRTKERGLSEEYENEDEKKKQNKKSKTEQKPLQI
jgi:hypothetical protein